MDDVIPLYFGESSQPTPPFIVEAAVRALREGHTFYSENAGLPMLRRTLADQYERLHGVVLDPSTEIVVSASGVQALHLAIRSVVEPGDEVLILSPAWPNSSSIVSVPSCTGVPRDVPLVFTEGRYMASISPRSSRRSRRVHGSSSSPRRRTRLAGWRAPRSSVGSSNSVAGTASGCSLTRSTSASTTGARRSASRRRRSCGSASAATRCTSCSPSRRRTA